MTLLSIQYTIASVSLLAQRVKSQITPYRPWSKVVQYIGNRAPVGMRPESYISHNDDCGAVREYRYWEVPSNLLLDFLRNGRTRERGRKRNKGEKEKR